MFYEIGLPDDYDMGTIRRRVVDKASLFDSYPGLLRKVFLANDTRSEALGDAFGKAYGAFYLWHSAAAARDFLLSPAFDAFCTAYGRPRVKTWLVLSAVNLPVDRAARATIETARLGPDGKITPFPLERGTGQEQGVRPGGPIADVVCLNPTAWECLRFRLWRSEDHVAPPKCGDSRLFDVLHVSTPDRIAAGRPFVAPDLSAAERQDPRRRH